MTANNNKKPPTLVQRRIRAYDSDMWWSWISVLVFVLISGCATVRDAGEACDTYVADQLADVFRHVESYQRDGFTEGLINAARGSLELARQSLEGEPMLEGLPTCPRQHPRKDSWKDLRADFEAADALVREVEEARGVRFVEFSADRPQWVDRTTGKPISDDYADSI